MLYNGKLRWVKTKEKEGYKIEIQHFPYKRSEVPSLMKWVIHSISQNYVWDEKIATNCKIFQ